MDINDSAREDSEVRTMVGKTYIVSVTNKLLWKYGLEDATSEGSDGNEEHVTEQWRKGDPCYKLAKEPG